MRRVAYSDACETSVEPVDEQALSLMFEETKAPPLVSFSLFHQTCSKVVELSFNASVSAEFQPS